MTISMAVGMLCRSGNVGYENQNRQHRLQKILEKLSTFVENHNEDVLCFLVAEYAFDAPLSKPNLDPSADTYREIVREINGKVPKNCVFIPGTIFIPKSGPKWNWVRNKLPGVQNYAINRALIWHGDKYAHYDKKDESARTGSYQVISGEGGNKVFTVTIPQKGSIKFGLDICKEHAGNHGLNEHVDIHILIADGKERSASADLSSQYFLQCNAETKDSDTGGIVFDTRKNQTIKPATSTGDHFYTWSKLPLTMNK